MKISVAGTGYVGLVAGVCFAEMGHDVTCVDVDEKKIELMKSGVSPIYEADLESLMQKNYAAGNLHYTTDYQLAYRDAEVIFIGVGTPEQPDGSANLSYIAGVSYEKISFPLRLFSDPVSTDLPCLPHGLGRRCRSYGHASFHRRRHLRHPRRRRL